MQPRIVRPRMVGDAGEQAQVSMEQSPPSRAPGAERRTLYPARGESRRRDVQGSLGPAIGADSKEHSGVFPGRRSWDHIDTFIAEARLPSLRLFLFALVLNCALATHLFLRVEYIFVDSIARTMHALYVFWGYGAPHLAAIGFVWMPLPTVVQLPLVLWKPLAQTGLAGGLQSALCMAVAFALLDGILRILRTSRRTRWALLALFQLNPMILMYGANGMSEAMLICVMLWMCYSFLRWCRCGQSRYVILLGCGAGSAVMTRYEGFGLVAAGAVAVTLVNLRHGASRARVGGELLAYLAPPVYALLVWVQLNYSIMGDPLYFYRGAYSNLAQIAFFPKELAVLTHNPVLTTLYVAERIVLMAPAYLPVVLLVTVAALLRLDATAFGLLLLPASLLAFGWLNQFQGQSYGWFRFFIYAVPGLAIGIPLLTRPGLFSQKLSRQLVGTFLVLSIPGGLLTGIAMLDPSIGREEFPAARAALTDTRVERSDAVEQRILAYLKEHAGKRSVLLDDFSGLELIRMAGGTDLFVAGVDPDFQETLNNPHGKVDYILVPKPEGLGTLDAINNRYYSIFMGSMSFARVEQDWGQWRLLRVVASPGR